MKASIELQSKTADVTFQLWWCGSRFMSAQLKCVLTISNSSVLRFHIANRLDNYAALATPIFLKHIVTKFRNYF